MTSPQQSPESGPHANMQPQKLRVTAVGSEFQSELSNFTKGNFRTPRAEDGADSLGQFYLYSTAHYDLPPLFDRTAEQMRPWRDYAEQIAQIGLRRRFHLKKPASSNDHVIHLRATADDVKLEQVHISMPIVLDREMAEKIIAPPMFPEAQEFMVEYTARHAFMKKDTIIGLARSLERLILKGATVGELTIVNQSNFAKPVDYTNPANADVALPEVRPAQQHRPRNTAA